MSFNSSTRWCCGESPWCTAHSRDWSQRSRVPRVHSASSPLLELALSALLPLGCLELASTLFIYPPSNRPMASCSLEGGYRGSRGSAVEVAPHGTSISPAGYSKVLGSSRFADDRGAAGPDTATDRTKAAASASYEFGDEAV